jgi:ribosomal protein S8
MSLESAALPQQASRSKKRGGETLFLSIYVRNIVEPLLQLTRGTYVTAYTYYDQKSIPVGLVGYHTGHQKIDYCESVMEPEIEIYER